MVLKGFVEGCVMCRSCSGQEASRGTLEGFLGVIYRDLHEPWRMLEE